MGFTVVRLMLEEDGTEIEEDEELMGFVGSVILGSADGETWTPSAQLGTSAEQR